MIAAVAGVLVALYVLYGYRQAHNDVQLKTRDLGVAKKEFQALSKRFDMLSNELKGIPKVPLARELKVQEQFVNFIKFLKI